LLLYVCKFLKSAGEEVRRAIHLAKDLNYFHSKAAEATGVTLSVLKKYWKSVDDNYVVLSQGNFKPVFNEEQEKQIIAYCNDLANRFTMTKQSLGQLAFKMAEENQLTHPFKNGTAGADWISSFLIRHQKELSVRIGTPTSLVRITSFTKSAVYRFFDQLEEIIGEKNYNDTTIFNADETGVSIVPNKGPRRSAKTGVGTIPVMTPAERGQLITIMCCASANGQFIPPMFVFPNNCKDKDISRSPPGSLYTYSNKGWSTSHTFCVWLKHFRNHATPSKTTQVLLIIDNHGSHISYQAVKFATKYNIDILTLPPHTTHKMQPMDISFFKLLRKRYGQALEDWLAKNTGLKPRTDNIRCIIKTAYQNSCKESTMINGFRKTGIWDNDLGRPNRYVFADTEFSDIGTVVPLDEENQVIEANISVHAESTSQRITDDFQDITDFHNTPWDLDKPGTSAHTSEAKRKIRPKGTSELITSSAIIAKLQERECKKRKKNSSDSEETATLRKSMEDKRVLGSNSKIG
ncbi:unnamed protein product, partial [Allacma fusca]